MSKFEQMQKVGEERKKEKSLERAAPVGNMGCAKAASAKDRILKSLSQIIPRHSGQRFLNVMDIYSIQHLVKL